MAPARILTPFIINDSDRERERDADFEYDGPSKSQRKRDMLALQKLGVELVDLPRDRLKRVPMPDDLREAVEAAQRISDHEGKRRQLQYVGKIMRHVDPAPIQAVLDGFKGASRAETAALHALERWRERLLADDSALTKLAERHTAALNPSTMQELRTAIRGARKEKADNKPPRHYRELFRVLKAILHEDGADEVADGGIPDGDDANDAEVHRSDDHV